jgi:hypothetical protein
LLTIFLPGCHSPPVSDKELIDIIKAFNAAKHNLGAKLIWQCAICIKVKNAVNQQNRQLIAVKKATPRQVPAPQKAIVIDDDDDETIALGGPSVVPVRNATTNPEVSRLSNAIVSQHSSATQDALSHSKLRSFNPTSYDHVRPPPGRPSGSKDKEIQIIDDPFLVPDPTPRASKRPQTSSSTKLQVISEFIDLTISGDEGGGSDDALEYLTPEPTSKQIVHVEEVPLILTSNQVPPNPLPRDARPTARKSTMTTTQLPNHLLTRWLNDRSTTAGDKPDLWVRACLRRNQDAASRSLGSANTQPPSISPPSRRKFKAHNLNESSFTHLRTTVFLSAERWLREKEANLPLE